MLSRFFLKQQLLSIKGSIRAVSTTNKTLFEKIASKEIPTDILYEDDKVYICFNIYVVLCIPRYQSLCSCSFSGCTKEVRKFKTVTICTVIFE